MRWHAAALLLLHFIVTVHLLGFKLVRPGNVESAFCSANNNKLLSLFNLLCNTTQTTSITTRDACYGCFFRAGNIPAGTAQLVATSQCATLYLTNSTYAICATGLSAIISGVRPMTPPTASGCYTGYCEFVQCVRRINGNRLINQCLVQTLINRDLNVEAQRVGFYINTTSCILARARCDAYNPVTGILQNPVNTVRLPDGAVSNALQISPVGDIRILAFPSRLIVGDKFCRSQAILDQSSFGDSIC